MKCPNPEIAISEQLTQKIRDKIHAAGGALSFADFMATALYEPGLGYYAAGSHKLGAKGDFVTAPELTPYFAKTIANTCRELRDHLGEYDVLELGAGSGVFARDLLEDLQKTGHLPRKYYILEVSPDLRERQKNLLKSLSSELYARCEWLETLSDVSITGLIFANEVLDALPVHLFTVDEGQIKERCVTWRDDRFEWVLSEATICHTSLNHLPEGYQSEAHIFHAAWVRSVADALKQGLILFFDYGYGRAEYYHPDRAMGTLMCYHAHQKNDDPLERVGLQDITAHVDFTTVVESAYDAGCVLSGYTTQAAFLTASGILDLLEDVYDIHANQAVKVLLLPSEMGEAVKVMGLSKAYAGSLRGFSGVDRSRDL